MAIGDVSVSGYAPVALAGWNRVAAPNDKRGAAFSEHEAIVPAIERPAGTRARVAGAERTHDLERFELQDRKILQGTNRDAGIDCAARDHLGGMDHGDGAACRGPTNRIRDAANSEGGRTQGGNVGIEEGIAEMRRDEAPPLPCRAEPAAARGSAGSSRRERGLCGSGRACRGRLPSRPPAPPPLRRAQIVRQCGPRAWEGFPEAPASRCR